MEIFFDILNYFSLIEFYRFDENFYLEIGLSFEEEASGKKSVDG